MPRYLTPDEIAAELNTVFSLPLQKTAMRTYSGQPIDYRNPQQTEVLWDDLEVGMRKLRYAGHLNFPISRHLLLCVYLAKIYRDHGGAPLTHRERALIGAHDLHESYVMDIPKGLKECLGEAYAVIEAAWEEHVHRELGLWPITQAERDLAKHYDTRALALEMHFLGWCDWAPGIEVLDATGGAPTDAEIFAWRRAYSCFAPFEALRDELRAATKGRLR